MISKYKISQIIYVNVYVYVYVYVHTHIHSNLQFGILWKFGIIKLHDLIIFPNFKKVQDPKYSISFK